MEMCVLCGKPVGFFSKKNICKSCYRNIEDRNFKTNNYINRLLSYNGNDFDMFTERCNIMYSLIKNKDGFDPYNMSANDYKVSHIEFMYGEYIRRYNSVLFGKNESNGERFAVVLNDYLNLLDNMIEKYYHFNKILQGTRNDVKKMIDNINAINDSSYDYYFDVRKLKKNKNTNGSYLISNEYKSKVINDVKEMNNFIELINDDYKMKVSLIDIDKLNFKSNQFDYVYLHFDPFTKTGKEKKIPFEIVFDISNNGYDNESHGGIYYNKDGVLQKSFFVSRENGTLIIFETSLIGGKNLITKVYKKGNNGEKIYIYK